MSVASQPETPSAAPRVTGRSKWPGRIGFGLTAGATVITLGALFSILGYLIIHGIGAINWNFLVKEPAAVGETGGGIAPSLIGTAILVTISSIVGVPLGVGVGVYLSELAGDTRFASFTRVAINTFIGVPSIVTGIFVYFVIVKPTKSIREGGFALGATQWQVTIGLVLPAARGGVITGGVLAVARVAGETAPLILTALGNEYYPSGLFHPIDEITLRILKYARGPYDVWHEQAYGAALLLVVGVAVGSLLLRLTTRDYDAPGR